MKQRQQFPAAVSREAGIAAEHRKKAKEKFLKQLMIY